MKSSRRRASGGQVPILDIVVPPGDNAPPPGYRSGAYHNSPLAGFTVAKYDAFQAWRGPNPIKMLNYYVQTGGAVWSGFTAESSTMLTNLAANEAAGRSLSVDLPLFPDLAILGLTRAQAMAQAASGAYDDEWTAMLDRHLSFGMYARPATAPPHFAIAYEADGDYFHWNPDKADGPTELANWKAAWVRLRNIILSKVPGAVICFSMVNGSAGDTSQGGYTANDLNPGNALWDVLALSAFNQWYKPITGLATSQYSALATQPERDLWHTWVASHFITDPGFLNDYATWAAARGKKLGIREWGCWDKSDGHGGADHPQYVQALFDWFRTQKIVTPAFQLYQNDPLGSGVSTYIGPDETPANNHNLLSAAVYKATFGQGPW